MPLKTLVKRIQENIKGHMKNRELYKHLFIGKLALLIASYTVLPLGDQISLILYKLFHKIENTEGEAGMTVGTEVAKKSEREEEQREH